jgi:hypothetical protein
MASMDKRTLIMDLRVTRIGFDTYELEWTSSTGTVSRGTFGTYSEVRDWIRKIMD